MYGVRYGENRTQDAEHAYAEHIGDFFTLVVYCVHSKGVNQYIDRSKEPQDRSNYISKFSNLSTSSHV